MFNVILKILNLNIKREIENNKNFDKNFEYFYSKLVGIDNSQNDFNIQMNKINFLKIFNSEAYTNIIFTKNTEFIFNFIIFAINKKIISDKKIIFLFFKNIENFNLIKEEFSPYIEKIKDFNKNLSFNYEIINIENDDNLKNINIYESYDTNNFSNFIIIFSKNFEGLKLFIESIKFPSIDIFYSNEMIKNINLFKPLYDEIYNIINKNKINLETAKKFGAKWILNILKNREYYLKYNNISIIKNCSNNIPSIIIGAGNSLFKNIDNIKKLKDYFIIISVDTSFRVLFKNGIIPDFIISYDAQSINNSYILSIQDKIDKENLPVLIVPPTINNILIKKYNGPIIFSSLFFFPIKIFNEFKNEKIYELSSGGTVTSAAYDLANFIGSEYKFIAGLDLCYSDNLLHSKGSLYEDIFYLKQNYTNTSLSFISKIMLKSFPFFSLNLNNKKVRTDVKFEMFTFWFSNYIDDKTYFITSDTLLNEKFKYIETNKIFKNEINNLFFDDKLKEKKTIFIKNLSNLKKQFFLLKYENIKKLKNIDLINYENYINNLKKDLNELKTILENIVIINNKIIQYRSENLKIDSLLIQLDFLENKLKDYSEGFNLLNLALQKEILEIEFFKFSDEENYIYKSLNFFNKLLKVTNKILYILSN
jgi:hypothetical protein